MKTFLIAVIIATVLTTIAAAQTAAHRPATAARPNTNAPTKVTGAGVKTDSGLQYWDIRVGLGQVAKAGDKVKVHYTGWLTTGKKFDSSVGAAPFEFTIGASEVIKGWDEGVAGMKVGGKRKLRIPPAAGYGAHGAGGGLIPPNATLIFTVELLKVQ